MIVIIILFIVVSFNFKISQEVTVTIPNQCLELTVDVHVCYYLFILGTGTVLLYILYGVFSLYLITRY